MGNNATIASGFHGYLDTELLSAKDAILETRRTKRIIVQEREVSYRFYPHFHPYVGQLVQRLLRGSTASLQAADTDYEPGNSSLPGSVEVSVGHNNELSIPGGSPFVLLGALEATLSGSATISLPDKIQLRLADAARVTLSAGMRAVLFEGITKTPPTGSVFALDRDTEASILSDTKATLASATGITLYDGTQATAAAGTHVLLLGGTRLTLPDGTQATLRKSKPRPVSSLYAEFFESLYGPSDELVRRPYPVKDLDFTPSGAYSVYNWELFFHVPLTIAMHLSKNQRFAEAQRWFHYLFDPTDDSDGPTPERFWKVRPFHTTDVRKIEEILSNLSDADPETVESIKAWQDAPFRPHVIARHRQQAFMYKTVMAYLDNLISWGDSLFRQDTGEAIDEAMMLYILAANILGPRPQQVPKKGSVRPQTYANLRADLDQFGNVMREVETAVPFDLMPFPADSSGGNERLATVRSLGKALYFCVPRNDKLLSYWDTVADRLFKIRNSLNIQGIFRQLALFEPPIDPAMLARAAAAGLDVGAVVSGLNQPLPLVRFQLLVQKAAEICQEVKSLGNNLLSAMEKEDGEALAILRARHERAVMEMVEHVKYGQLQEAIKSREGLFTSLALAAERYTYYEQQLGKKRESDNPAEKITIPELDELDKESLEKMKFTLQEPEVNPRDIEVNIAQDLGASEGKIVSSHEQQEFDSLESATKLRQEAANLDMVAKFLSLIPELGGQAQPMGVGAAIQFGGRALSTQLSLAADGNRILSERDTHEAGKAAKIATYARREQDWAFQSNLAAGEINQIFKQLRAAQIREAIAEQELKNHRRQMKHAEEIEHFLNEEGAGKNGKKTNKALYTWMKREVKGLYAQCFQFGFDVARKAERALQHELGNPDLSYLQFGYLAGKEGLLAGERLHLDIKRMEMAYHDLNRREYELTKHVSLLQVDPLALLQLRATGRCTVTLPETLFDMDGPGHYFRRIKSVAMSIPCVTGPYASVGCTLTLLKSSVRRSQVLRDGAYAREDAQDDRFSDYFGSMQSIVTSSGQNDTGLFETNLRDERYLPFEGSGVVSEWRLQLPADPSKDDPRQFDYDSISDVILHLRYTAREGGGLLRTGAMENLTSSIAEARAAGSVRLFSVRHEFPTEWAKFTSVRLNETGAPSTADLSLGLREEHYPFWSKDALKSVERIDVLAKKAVSNTEISYVANGTSKTATPVRWSGDLSAANLDGSPISTPTGNLTLKFDDNTMDEIWVAVTWSSKATS